MTSTAPLASDDDRSRATARGDKCVDRRLTEAEFQAWCEAFQSGEPPTEDDSGVQWANGEPITEAEYQRVVKGRRSERARAGVGT